MQIFGNGIIFLITILFPLTAFGNEIYACGEWKREHPQINAGNALNRDLYPIEAGRPFTIIFNKDKFEILDRYEKKRVLSFVGQINHNTSIYKSSETGSAGFSDFYSLDRFNDKTIELELISKDLIQIYETYCYR